MTLPTTAPELTFRLTVAVSLVWLLAAVTTLLLRRGSAALRHQLWSLSTAAVLLLPALLITLPEWRVGKIELPAPVAVNTATPAPAEDVVLPAPVPPAQLRLAGP